MIVDETVTEDYEDDEDDGDQEISLDRIKTECSAMVKLLKNLQDEEQNLDCQLKILAREALLCGFDVDVVEPPQPKRRKMAGRKKQMTAKTDKAEKRFSIGSTSTADSNEPIVVAAVVDDSEAKDEEGNSIDAEAEIVEED